jgi:cyanate permease
MPLPDVPGIVGVACEDGLMKLSDRVNRLMMRYVSLVATIRYGDATPEKPAPVLSPREQRTVKFIMLSVLLFGFGMIGSIFIHNKTALTVSVLVGFFGAVLFVVSVGVLLRGERKAQQAKQAEQAEE